MSLFNMAAGYAPECKFVLGVLGFTRENMEEFEKIPRFRDAYIICDEQPYHLVIMTRTGGGNRDDYSESNEWLRSLPGFVKDYDDDFDSTFAHWVYVIPEKFKDVVDKTVKNGKEAGWTFPSPMKRFEESLAAMTLSEDQDS